MSNLVCPGLMQNTPFYTSDLFSFRNSEEKTSFLFHGEPSFILHEQHPTPQQNWGGAGEHKDADSEEESSGLDSRELFLRVLFWPMDSHPDIQRQRSLWSQVPLIWEPQWAGGRLGLCLYDNYSPPSLFLQKPKHYMMIFQISLSVEVIESLKRHCQNRHKNWKVPYGIRPVVHLLQDKFIVRFFAPACIIRYSKVHYWHWTLAMPLSTHPM